MLPHTKWYASSTHVIAFFAYFIALQMGLSVVGNSDHRERVMERQHIDCQVVAPIDERVDSPCIASCHLQAQGFCTGCYRHITEIVYWNKMSASAKLTMLAAQTQRQVVIAQSPDQPNLQAHTRISSEIWQATKTQCKLHQVSAEVDRNLAELQQTR